LPHVGRDCLCDGIRLVVVDTAQFTIPNRGGVVARVWFRVDRCSLCSLAYQSHSLLSGSNKERNRVLFLATSPSFGVTMLPSPSRELHAQALVL